MNYPQSYQGRLRENTQMGAELIGVESIEADAEMLALVVDCLTTIGLREFQISVGNVDYFQSLIEDAELGEESEARVRELIGNRNFPGVEEYLDSIEVRRSSREALVALEDLYGGEEVLDQAEEEFGKVDRSILFTMADHLDFAVRRIQNGEQISNPLTDDIRIMFYKEYKVAGCIRDLLKEKLGIRIDEHEIGYIALHVHAAIVDENVSQAMEIARTVRECICMVEEETGKSIDVMSLSYNRLMNHVRYMVARAIHGEKLKMSLNDYMFVKFPGPYMTAEKICRKMEKSLKLPIPDIEIGYLAMHLERMMDREEE